MGIYVPRETHESDARVMLSCLFVRLQDQLYGTIALEMLSLSSLIARRKTKVF